MNAVKLTVLEVDGAALRVRKLALVEHLQEDVGDVWVRLLELVCATKASAVCSQRGRKAQRTEQQNAVRLATDRFRQLASVLEADVSRRSTCMRQTASILAGRLE